MMKNSLLALACLAAGSSAFAQTPDSAALQYAQTLSTAELRQHLEVLTSDSLQGRETGTIGQKRAAAYLSQQFQEIGLQPGNPSTNTYYQHYPLYKSSWQNVYLADESGKLSHLQELIYFGSRELPEETRLQTVFVGEGNESDYQELDVQGKLVLIYDTEDNWRAKRQLAQEKGAAGAIVALAAQEGSFTESLERASHYMAKPQLRLKKEENDPEGNILFLINPKHAARLAGLSEKKMQKLMEKKSEGKLTSYAKLKAHSLRVLAQRQSEEIEVENVVGFLEGSDKKDELLVITAHYDHVGMGENGEIFRGADDDASGTATVLELADAFVQAKEAGHAPSRSILFMTVSGEEKGLLGSAYYASNPLYPMENTITNLNIDMVGRVDPKHEGNPNYIYLIGSDKLSTELHELSENVNSTYSQLELDYTYNDEKDPNRYYYRSDHYNFAKHGVPVIFYFNGTHADYHKSTDTIEKINFEKMQKIGRLIFHTAWELANRPERPALDKQATQSSH